MNTDKNKPEGIDELLKQAFLETDFEDPKNEKLLEASAMAVLSTSAPATTTHPFKKILGSSKLWVGLLGTTMLSFSVLYYYSNRHATVVVPQAVQSNMSHTDSATLKAIIAVKLQNAGVVIPKNDTPQKMNAIHSTEATQPVAPLKYLPPVVRNPQMGVNTDDISPAAPLQKQDSAYRFPTLTDKEIAANNHHKKSMVAAVVKQKTSSYVFVHRGSFKYMGVMVSLADYYMQTTTVTNLDYRTFLNDLLIQNRKSDFLIAKPDQKQWTMIPGLTYSEYMKENYFSNSKYDLYPVVNISRQGAEMYCKWLKEESTSAFADKFPKAHMNVRLPSQCEWAYAAASCSTNAIYPWNAGRVTSSTTAAELNKVTNEYGCFLANFCLKKYTGSLDSMHKCVNGKFKNAYTTAGYLAGEDMYIAPVASYNFNQIGLDCMSGNVAQMVEVIALDGTKKTSIGTKGGSWNSDAEHLKIEGPDEYAGQTSASPFIGFRPVIYID